MDGSSGSGSESDSGLDRDSRHGRVEAVLRVFRPAANVLRECTFQGTPVRELCPLWLTYHYLTAISFLSPFVQYVELPSYHALYH